MPAVKVVDKFINFSPSKIVDDEGFTLKESRSSFKKRKNAELNDMQDNGLAGPLPKLVNLWVYHVLKGDKNVLRKYLETKNIKAYDIIKTFHIDSKFNSFKISVSKYNKSKILNRSFFPNGIKCKSWHDRNSHTVQSRSFTNKFYMQ